MQDLPANRPTDCSNDFCKEQRGHDFFVTAISFSVRVHASPIIICDIYFNTESLEFPLLKVL